MPYSGFLCASCIGLRYALAKLLFYAVTNSVTGRQLISSIIIALRYALARLLTCVLTNNVTRRPLISLIIIVPEPLLSVNVVDLIVFGRVSKPCTIDLPQCGCAVSSHLSSRLVVGRCQNYDHVLSAHPSLELSSYSIVK